MGCNIVEFKTYFKLHCALASLCSSSLKLTYHSIYWCLSYDCVQFRYIHLTLPYLTNTLNKQGEQTIGYK